MNIEHGPCQLVFDEIFKAIQYKAGGRRTQAGPSVVFGTRV